MGDIVVYERDLVTCHRVWVPSRDVRWWLRFYRRQGLRAWTLKQWKRQGMQPERPLKAVPKTVGHLDHLIGIRG